MMKCLFGLCLAVLSTGTCIAGEKLTVANGKVSFEMPDGFKRMSAQQAAIKYPRTAVPEHVFSDSTTKVSVAAGFTPSANLSAKDLPQLMDYLQKSMEGSITGLKWISKGFKDIGGAKWIYFELQVKAPDAEITNTMLFTAIDCGMVSFNFNSTLSEYPAHAVALQRSRNSIKVIGDTACRS